jgi:2-amino-4-hydroxy-6-hydroxymethyldihydropteridine diphosphokinase
VAVEVFLSLGANLGDPVQQLRAAVRRLQATLDIDAVSSLYRTAPLGLPDQPDFYNLVLRGRTRNPAEEVLRAALSVEAELGRRRGAPNEPRTIDIDVLDYDSRVMEVPGLTLPHPRLHERNFVLVPLGEIAPQWRHPVSRRSVEELILAPEARGAVRRVGALPPSQATDS